MRSSSSDGASFLRRRLTVPAIVLAAAALAAMGEPAAPEPANLLRNGGFEENRGEGTVPDRWGFVDENGDSIGWTAPRAERSIGGIGPRAGRFLAGCDTEMMGVDTNGPPDGVPRSAIFQTVRAPAGARGTFSVHYNDIGSTALGHVSALRLAYTVGGGTLGSIRTPAAGEEEAAAREARRGVWSRQFFRVSQRIPSNPEAAGDWTLASIPVAVPGAPGGGDVNITVWIGIFEPQNSTEIGYWRIDDAALILDGS
jgi:hypothetical protein